MRLWQCVQRCSVPLSVFFMSFQQRDHSPHAGVVSCLKNKGCHYETNKNLAHHSSYKTQKGSQKGDSGTLNVVWKNRIVWKSIRVRENQISFNTVWGLTADFMRQTHSGKWTFNFLFWWGIIVTFFVGGAERHQTWKLVADADLHLFLLWLLFSLHPFPAYSYNRIIK